jgi:hypothetical protein
MVCREGALGVRGTGASIVAGWSVFVPVYGPPVHTRWHVGVPPVHTRWQVGVPPCTPRVGYQDWLSGLPLIVVGSQRSKGAPAPRAPPY